MKSNGRALSSSVVSGLSSELIQGIVTNPVCHPDYIILSHAPCDPKDPKHHVTHHMTMHMTAHAPPCKDDHKTQVQDM
jgi:hypothetical protein